MGASRTLYFDVAGCYEVAIKRQYFAEPPSAHDLEAHCIDKQIRSLIVSAQPSPGFVFNRRVRMR